MMADEAPSCKVFIRGLANHTTIESVKAHMSQFGGISDGVIMLDKFTGQSRGFGFITFQSEHAAAKCLAERHKIDGANVEVRRAVPRDEMKSYRMQTDGDTQTQSCKVFVGGFPETVTEDELRSVMEQFGPLREVSLIMERETNTSRGFGFLVYENESSATKALGPHNIGGRQCEVKRAVPREVTAGWKMGRGAPLGGDMYGRDDPYRGGVGRGRGRPRYEPYGYGPGRMDGYFEGYGAPAGYPPAYGGYARPYSGGGYPPAGYPSPYRGGYGGAAAGGYASPYGGGYPPSGYGAEYGGAAAAGGYGGGYGQGGNGAAYGAAQSGGRGAAYANLTGDVA